MNMEVYITRAIRAFDTCHDAHHHGRERAQAIQINKQYRMLQPLPNLRRVVCINIVGKYKYVHLKVKNGFKKNLINCCIIKILSM